MQSASNRVHHPADIESAAPSAETRDMVSALARLQKHVGQFACEIDTLDAAGWEHFARDFDDLNDSQIAGHSARQCDGRISYLLLRRQGRPVAGARASVITHPAVSGGVTSLHFAPLWRRRGETVDLTIYRAALGAIVQEYCIRRGHRLAIIPCANSEFHKDETKELADFGFAATTSGEYRYWSRPSARITGNAIDALQGVQRTIRRWRRRA
jgi:hypothetical protein